MKEFTGHDLTEEDYISLYGMTRKELYEELYWNQEHHKSQMERAEKQKSAWDELCGGDHVMCGNSWDPWNQMGISWKLYNQYKTERGYSDEFIAETINSLRQRGSYEPLNNMAERVEKWRNL